MNHSEHLGLLSERSALTQLLDETPDDAILVRGSLAARLEEVEHRIKACPPVGRAPAQARLTFRGRPVVGSHGVFAQFGAKASAAFTDLVAKVAAARSGQLSWTGPVPNRDENQLLITSTAVGSFGFQFEEYRDGQLPFEDETSVGHALELTRRIFESTLGTDDELVESVSETDPRAIEAIRAFLQVLAGNEAVCTLDLGDREFRFKDVGQVRRSLGRLAQENLREEEEMYAGEFQGVLPKRRTFEFKRSGDDEVIAGKVGPTIKDPDVINNRLHVPTKIRVMATQVGTGKPRYVLLQLPNDWDE